MKTLITLATLIFLTGCATEVVVYEVPPNPVFIYHPVVVAPPVVFHYGMYPGWHHW